MTKELLEKYIAFTKKWEGGLSKDTSDSASVYPCPTKHNGVGGWHTNIGITYRTWVSVFGNDQDERFFEMNNEDWFRVFKTLYWDSVKADLLPDSIAIYVTGIAWGSGKYRAGATLQYALNKLGYKLLVDGNIGARTIQAANAANERDLFDQLLHERETYFKDIGRPGTRNAKFLKGWINRLEDYRKAFRP